ncbi:MAG TPA: hypothetical protein VKT28_16660 [Puia sp.]|nr:hypothetical protein [Puia sp.]
MKKNLIAAACIAGFLSFSAFSAKADINQKVLQSFHSVFSKATNIKWTEFQDHYYVSFYQNDILIRANYDLSGNIMNSIRYYKEQHLPLNILCKLKKVYSSKAIEMVTEVSNQDGTAYFIQLKDDKGWTTVKSDESATFEVVDKFNK